MFKKKNKNIETPEEPIIQPEIERVSISEINEEIAIEETRKINEVLREILAAFLALSKEDKKIAIEKIKNGKI